MTTDTQRTAQELADECKRLADAYAFAGVPRGFNRDRATLHATIDRLRDIAALASQAEPVTDGLVVECPDCKGSEFVGFKRGIRCATCNGTGHIDPPAPAQAEQSEDGRDATLWRFCEERCLFPEYDGHNGEWYWPTSQLPTPPAAQTAREAVEVARAAIAAKEQQS